MNRKLLTIIALVICIISLYLWWFSDAKVITRSTEDLVECFEKESGDGRFGGSITTSTFRDLLDDKIGLSINRDDIPYASDFGSLFVKSDLVQMHSGLMNSPAIVTIEDQKIDITDIQDQQANVKLTFHIKTDKLNKNLDHQINCQLTYKKIDGDWLVSSAILTK